MITYFMWFQLNNTLSHCECNYTPPYSGIGVLYNWYAVTDARNIAPMGWHIPTKTEFDTLVTYLGGSSVAGGKLKEIGLIHWDTPNTGADNSSGFNAKGGGLRLTGGVFTLLNEAGEFWSSTPNSDPSYSYNLELYYTNSIGNVRYSEIKQGFSIRLVKDDSVNPGIMADNEGNTYPTTKIGAQVWMAANLKVKHYNDGTLIPEVINDAAWAALATGAMCWYNNTPS